MLKRRKLCATKNKAENGACVNFGGGVKIILYMRWEMYTSCAHSLDGVDVGERCISIETWYGYGWVESSSLHVRSRTCDVQLVIGCGHTCGETHVGMFVSVAALHVWEWAMLDGTINVTSTIHDRHDGQQARWCECIFILAFLSRNIQSLDFGHKNLKGILCSEGHS